MHFSILSPNPTEYSFLIIIENYQLLLYRCRVSISKVRICGCSEICGVVRCGRSVVRCSKDCGEGGPVVRCSKDHGEVQQRL